MTSTTHLVRTAPGIAAAAMLSVTLLAPAALAAPAPATETTDIDAVQAFVDRAVGEHMAAHDIPGAVFVMVADGQVAAAKGYGSTDLDAQVPVDAETTRFDIGSIGKLFTATAVLQQVEQERLDLDADVNTYLGDFRVPDTFDDPITPAHLLTHTAGFADRWLVGLWADAPDDLPPLSDSLPRHLPARIRPPGAVHQYGNYGMPLAGHLVEIVTGTRFEEYVHASILEPLGMTRTSYGTPPAEPAVDAVPHETFGGSSVAVERGNVAMPPAGGLWTTGGDIARFMLAHLGAGEHDGARILEPGTVARMHATQFSAHPDVPGLGYGFFEHRIGGRRGLHHGGGWIGAGAYLYLLPDDGIGLFLAYNHGLGAELAPQVIQGAVRRLTSVPSSEPVAVPPVATSHANSSAYAGQYRWNRRDDTTFARLAGIAMGSPARLDVRALDDATLETTMSPQAMVADTIWRPAGDGAFVAEDGSTLAFVSDTEGNVTGLHVMGAQLFTMERTAWYQANEVTVGLLVAFVLVLLAAVLAWPLGAVLRRRQGRPAPTTGALALGRVTGAAAGLALMFLGAYALHLFIDMGGFLQAGGSIVALLSLPLLVAALTAAAVWLLVRLWRGAEGTVAARVVRSALVLVLVAWLPFLHHLRLLGFHL